MGLAVALAVLSTAAAAGATLHQSAHNRGFLLRWWRIARPLTGRYMLLNGLSVAAAILGARQLTMTTDSLLEGMLVFLGPAGAAVTGTVVHNRLVTQLAQR